MTQDSSSLPRQLLATALAGLLAAPAWAADALPYQRLQRCPFSAAELSGATGLKVELVPLMEFAGAPKPMTAPEQGRLFLSCNATDGAAPATLLVTQQWFDPKTAAARIQALKARDLKDAQAVAGDPDGALWLTERDGTKQTLYYVRGGNVLVSVGVHGVPPSLQASLRAGLLKLKRVPS